MEKTITLKFKFDTKLIKRTLLLFFNEDLTDEEINQRFNETDEEKYFNPEGLNEKEMLQLCMTILAFKQQTK